MITLLRKREKITWPSLGCAGIAALCFLVLIAIPILQIRRFGILNQTHNDLKWIVMALHQYHDDHGMFPSPIVIGVHGQTQHSWRAVALQEMEELDKKSGSASMISGYDFDQKWNSKINLAASKSHPFNRNGYQFFAVVGPEAAWTFAGNRSFRDIKDGTSKTAFLIGIPESDVQWNEPVDLALSQSGQLLFRGKPVDLSGDLFVATADGSVTYFEEGLDSEIQKGLFTINGGEEFEFW